MNRHASQTLADQRGSGTQALRTTKIAVAGVPGMADEDGSAFQGRLREMELCICELADMAANVTKLAGQARKLARNAANEAEWSGGERGQALAVFAEHLSTLAARFSDTGRLMVSRTCGIQHAVHGIQAGLLDSDPDALA